MRGSFRINFWLKSVWPFRQCTFRLLQSFNILNSSDFAHIPNLSFPIDLIYNGENRLSISFFIFEKWASTHWGTLKKNRSNFEQRERKYANTWGGGGRARGQNSLQKHSYCIPFVFITLCFHSAFTFIRFQSCNWTVKSQFYHFPDRNNFRFNFSTFFNFQNAVKITQLVRLWM